MSNTIFDSHCHPNFPSYDQDRDEVIRRAFDSGVSMVCVGTDLETSKSSIKLAQSHEGIWASVGLHPNDIVSIKYPVLSIMDYEKLLSEDKVVAVGEVGLDYYRTPERDSQAKQRETFEKFLDLAIRYDKPIIIHCRDAAKGSTGPAYTDLLKILSTKYLIHNTNLRGVVHSYTGSLDEAKKFFDLGLCLSFNGIITFARQYDEVVKYAPLGRILLETDSPFLTPEPYRGKRNEPAYVIEVAKKLAELKNEPLEKIIKQTTQNCKQLFGIFSM